MLGLIVASVLVATTCADHFAPRLLAHPLVRAGPYLAPAPVYHAAPAPAYAETVKPYAFAYGVDDSAVSGSAFSAKAADDGKAVHGSYSVRIILILILHTY